MAWFGAVGRLLSPEKFLRQPAFEVKRLLVRGWRLVADWLIENRIFGISANLGPSFVWNDGLRAVLLCISIMSGEVVKLFLASLARCLGPRERADLRLASYLLGRLCFSKDGRLSGSAVASPSRGILFDLSRSDLSSVG